LKADFSTFGGIAIALLGIGGGLALEGGKLSQVFQPTAALIVLGGTLGAVMIHFPFPVIVRAIVQLKEIFSSAVPEPDHLVRDLLRYAYKARKEGILSLDPELARIRDPFLKESLMLAIDGMGADEIRKQMDFQLDYQSEIDERVPKVFDTAGGIAPTIGIVGAVLGLIQTMQHLQDINQVGNGIAVAFVATIYGVGAANLLFLPFAGKLRLRLRERQMIQEITLEAVLAIADGVSPRNLEKQLSGYLGAPLRPRLKKVVNL